MNISNIYKNFFSFFGNQWKTLNGQILHCKIKWIIINISLINYAFDREWCMYVYTSSEAELGLEKKVS
jgi:hypothetical protein